MPDLLATIDLLKLFGDPSRLRLLNLVGGEELTVAEMTAITGLTQSRVSTHLGRLRDAGLVRVRKSGSAAFYALDEGAMPEEPARLWRLLRETADDALLADDARRATEVVSARTAMWADSVAGRMERHYSPGRTWEAAARALVGLADLGDVLDVASGDGALAELVSARARSVTCLDISERVVEAGRSRRARHAGVRFELGDMHDLPFDAAQFDHVMLVNSLSYADTPAQVLAEAARVARDGATLVVATLAEHAHDEVAERYNHRQRGFSPRRLRRMVSEAGFSVDSCAVTSRERRVPHFEIVTLYAHRKARP